MPYAARYPLPKLGLTRPWEQSPVISTGLTPRSCASRAGSILVLSLPVSLLPHIDKDEQGCCQDNDDETFQKALVDLEF